MSIKSSTSTVVPNIQGEHHPEIGFKHHFKRVLVVASLYFRLQGTERPTEAELETVNRSFHLAWRCEALLFPAAVAGFVWRKIDLSSVLKQYCQDESCLSYLSQRLLDALPSWLRYRGILDDIRGVFTSLRLA